MGMNPISRKSPLLWLLTILSAATLLSCNPEPKETDLEFSFNTFKCDEGAENGYISVYLMESPYKYPVVVDMTVEVSGGKNALGEELNLDEIVKFNVTDKSYTVESTGPRSAKISDLEVTYSGYNEKVYFAALDNDFLQNETITLLFTITNVDGSNLGDIKTTTLTIIDDEKAPLVKVGYYDTRYEAPAEATNPAKGAFYLRLQKVGKYEYVASEWFGLSRPRLLGKYDPEKCTLTFDGTDYDHTLWKFEQPVSAFANDTIWANKFEDGKVTEILRFRGSGNDGKGPIVISTEAIEENKKGVLLAIESECGVDICSFDAESGVATGVVGLYDQMAGSSSMVFSEHNYEEETTRATTPSLRPFTDWHIAE